MNARGRLTKFFQVGQRGSSIGGESVQSIIQREALHEC
jgi:hypothetical protein